MGNPVFAVVAAVAVLSLLLFFGFYQKTFRLFGIVFVPDGHIGLIVKKFAVGGKSLQGHTVALNGEAGYQAKVLTPDWYAWYWPWQYEINLQPNITIPAGKIGIVESLDGSPLPEGKVLAKAVNCSSFQDAEAFLRSGGEKGKQVNVIASGTYQINTYLFSVKTTDPILINEDEVGIVTCLEGKPLEPGHIAGDPIDDKKHTSYQNFQEFLNAGGFRGLQPNGILAGTYFLNPWAVSIEKVGMSIVPIGSVGVIISYVGEEGKDVSGDEFKHGNLVENGKKGVWNVPNGPGKYALNPHTTKMEIVPTYNVRLNWATDRNESHKLDAGLSTITVRSKDGFPFNLDVSQIIHIPMNDAPKVIARFGSVLNLVSQVLEPTIGNYFRNSAQNSDVISFLSSRQERQEDAKKKIREVLSEYNVNAVDTLIGDITPPASLMETLTQRKIADEQVKTYGAQELSQKARQNTMKEQALADMQADLVRADQSVIIADKTAQASVKKAQGEATGITITANANAEATERTAKADATKKELNGAAEAGAILAIGKSTAEAYALQVKAMGEDNFTQLKVVETIGKDKVSIMPKVLIMGGGEGGGNSAMNAILGLKVAESIGENFRNEEPTGEKVTQLATKEEKKK